MGDFGACDANTALQAVYTAEKVAEQARDFMYKPDGGTQPVLARASLRSNPFLRADVSYKMGLALDQEPTVYAAGTECWWTRQARPWPCSSLSTGPCRRRRCLCVPADGCALRGARLTAPPQAEDMREEEARKAAAPPAPVRAKAALPEDDDEVRCCRPTPPPAHPLLVLPARQDDEDEVSSPPAAAPRRPGGMASLSLSTSRHADTLARAFAQLGRSLRRPRLERAQC